VIAGEAHPIRLDSQRLGRHHSRQLERTRASPDPQNEEKADAARTRDG
jgi:hypothetical protein